MEKRPAERVVSQYGGRKNMMRERTGDEEGEEMPPRGCLPEVVGAVTLLFEEVLRRSRAKGSQQHRVDDDVHK